MPKKKTLQYSYELGTFTVILKERKPGEKSVMQIGSLDARLSEDYLEKNPEFKTQLALFAENLAKQRGADCIRLFSISFQEINYTK